jgi:hypothetical protein
MFDRVNHEQGNDMTPFQTWCAKMGYDPNGEFFAKETSPAKSIGIGQIIEMISDDGSENPWFIRKGDFETFAIRFDGLSQNKKPQFDPHTFDFRQVLPKCWVREADSHDWYPTYFVKTVDAGLGLISYLVIGEDASGYYKQCVFTDPNEQRKNKFEFGDIVEVYRGGDNGVIVCVIYHNDLGIYTYEVYIRGAQQIHTFAEGFIKKIDKSELSLD